ncbi:hypothetical protein HX794_21190 [Pseudomonas costantinii]|uniref:hypothetical protein n=1 Tax=Pseudomonas costantinii TaxID=168469 RepID=UPI0015A43DB8|nr:hypothetical protein [Pseudomonas costantinii]NVZ22160.1 hypothetical protein [Pseudomonas costantinii]
MRLTKPNRQLRCDLNEAATMLKEAAHDLFRMAKRHDESGFLAVMEKISALHVQVDQMASYADEVKAGQITRAAE